MGKLSAWRYLKNNKKRAAILIISFGLYFALLYGVRFFVNTMYYTDESVHLGNSDQMQIASIKRGDKIPMNTSLWEEESSATVEEQVNEINRAFGEYAKELEKDERVDYVFLCYTYGIAIHTPLSSSYYATPMVTKDQARIICDYLGARLVEGSYPESPGDIVMDERMAKSCKVKVGDIIYDDLTRVSGIVSCSDYFAVGIEYDQLFVKRNLVFLNQGKLADLKAFFLDYGWEASEYERSEIHILRDVDNLNKLVEETYHSVDQPLAVMVSVITIIMGVVLYFVYQLHIKERYEEWCLYRSLGYSQREIFSLALREYVFCIIGGGILTILFLLLIFYVGGGMMDSKGIVYHYWIPDTFVQLIAIIIFLSGLMQIPVFQAMQHIRTIDAIEDDI